MRYLRVCKVRFDYPPVPDLLLALDREGSFGHDTHEGPLIVGIDRYELGAFYASLSSAATRQR
jgi:hypothetical protein